MLFIEDKIKVPDDTEEMHLCYLGENGCRAQKTKTFRKLASHPVYRCKNCGRAAHDSKNLCSPDKI